MLRSNRPAARLRRGLTLIELIVVLLILVALAGILVPMLPGMLTRAHTSSGATNTSEINKFIQTYEQLYFAYPNNFDALGDATTATVPDYIPNAANYTLGNLTAAELAALNNAGITTVAPMYATSAALTAAGGDASPTFNPYSSLVPVTLATGSQVLIMTGAQLAQYGILPAATTNAADRFVLFGVGKANTMIGKVMSDAPLHFGDGSATNPTTFYCRFAAIFRISQGGAANTLERCNSSARPASSRTGSRVPTATWRSSLRTRSSDGMGGPHKDCRSRVAAEVGHRITMSYLGGRAGGARLPAAGNIIRRSVISGCRPGRRTASPHDRIPPTGRPRLFLR